MVTGTVLTKENQHYINASYDEIRGIYSDYRNIIRPYIAFLELFDGEFPVEILNEIRAVFQHLARCYYNEGTQDAVITQDDIEKNIQKAKGHIHRALLDCFKYSCLTLFDEYQMFMRAYRYVDLSSLDNGEFLKKLHVLKKNARSYSRKARIAEGDCGDDKVVFDKYVRAFNEAVKLYKYIEAHAAYAARLRRKLRISSVLSVLGWIVGIVSGLIAIWEAWGTQILQVLNLL